MARRSPAVERSVAIINFLAAHPQEQFSLSELARELELNKATAHAMLATLSDAGYLIRDDAAKSYSLGPALIAVGNAATSSYPAARLAVPHMTELSRTFDLECIASTAIHDEIVILARAGTPRPLGINVQPGQRLPLIPPLGTVFVAWAGPADIDHWLAGLGPQAAERDRRLYRRALEAVRERGYSVGLGGESQQRLVEAMTEAGDAPTGGEEYALVELANAPAYPVSHIGAPVFGSEGTVVLALFLIGFRGQIPAPEVPRYAEALRAAAADVTTALGGHPPPPDPQVSQVPSG